MYFKFTQILVFYHVIMVIQYNTVNFVIFLDVIMTLKPHAACLIEYAHGFVVISSITKEFGALMRWRYSLCFGLPSWMMSSSVLEA